MGELSLGPPCFLGSPPQLWGSLTAPHSQGGLWEVKKFVGGTLGLVSL